jgi:subtilisin family serine protease
MVGSPRNRVNSTTGTGSDYGQMVKVAGPFWAYTTFANLQNQQWWADSRSDYGYCGAYIAAAHVAGVVALLRAYNPTWTPSQIVSQLLTTSSNHASPNEQIGYGIPNADLATPPPPPPISASITGPTIITRKGTYSWSASLTGGTPEVYQWSIRYDSGLQYGLGSGQSQAVTVFGGDGNFAIRVVIYSGGHSATASRYVTNCIGFPSGSCLQ